MRHHGIHVSTIKALNRATSSSISCNGVYTIVVVIKSKPFVFVDRFLHSNIKIVIGGSIPKWRFIISMSLGGPQHPHGFTLSVHNITGSTFRVPAFRSRRLVIASLKDKKVEGGPLGILLGVVSEAPSNRAVKFAFAKVKHGFKE